MLAAAAVFGGLAFKVTKDQEELTAIQTYKSIAASALEEAQAIAQRKMEGAESLALVWSYSFPNSSQWPFVGFRGYTELAISVARMSSTAGQGFMTIVRPEEVDAFEAHAKKIYHDYGYPTTAGWSDFGFGIYGEDPSYGYADGRFHDKYGNTTWGSKYEIMVPFLQHQNAFTTPSLLLKNIYQFDLRGRLLESIIDCGKAADPNTTVSPKCGGFTNFTEIYIMPGPSSVFFNPIFPVNNPTQVVGFIGTSINWAEILTNIVPDFVDGLDCVISNGYDHYTYVIQQGKPILLGEGDQHDEEYDTFRRTVTIYDDDTEANMSVAFSLSVYPTQRMFKGFRTNIPLFASLGFAAVIVLCTGIFFLYDHFMQFESFQQKKILEMKRRFVRFISHEIRTPLNVVCMGLDLLQAELQEKQEKAERRKLINATSSDTLTVKAEQDLEEETADTSSWLGLTQEIKENSHNAVSVLNDLLNYDKVESGTFELDMGRVDIWTSVKKTVKEFAIQARNRNVNLSLSMDDIGGQDVDIEKTVSGQVHDLYILGDDRRLAQVVRNLISNALKFTPEKQFVKVEMSYQADGLPDVEAFNDDKAFHKDGSLETKQQSGPTKVRAGSVIIRVKDDGVGLSSDQMKLLFNEGVQFNPNILQHGGGSGLGLCISKEIVELHSGRIEAKSDGIGFGTTFQVELPLYKSTGEDTANVTVETSSDKSHRGSHVVLVVDDVLTNSKMLVRLLERAGHTCLVASNGKEAVEAYEANQVAFASGEAEDRIDTVLMDFEMPEMNGPDATRQLRSMGCTTCIFGVTGNVLAEDVAAFKASGANAVLYKPINLPAIYAAWENMDLSRRRQLNV